MCMCVFISILYIYIRIAMSIRIQLFFTAHTLYFWFFFAEISFHRKCILALYFVTDWIESRHCHSPFQTSVYPFSPSAAVAVAVFSLAIHISPVCKLFSMILIHDYDNDYDCNIEVGGKMRIVWRREKKKKKKKLRLGIYTCLRTQIRLSQLGWSACPPVSTKMRKAWMCKMFSEVFT